MPDREGITGEFTDSGRHVLPVFALPDEWPEMYSAAGRSPSCPHQMHWDSAAGSYRCIHECGEVDKTPPDRKVNHGNGQ